MGWYTFHMHCELCCHCWWSRRKPWQRALLLCISLYKHVCSFLWTAWRPPLTHSLTDSSGVNIHQNIPLALRASWCELNWPCGPACNNLTGPTHANVKKMFVLWWWFEHIWGNFKHFLTVLVTRKGRGQGGHFNHLFGGHHYYMIEKGQGRIQGGSSCPEPPPPKKKGKRKKKRNKRKRKKERKKEKRKHTIISHMHII